MVDTKEKGCINMSFRVERSLKKEADDLFRRMGMNTSVALNMFLTQCVRDQAFPFTPSAEIPNARLREAMDEAEAIARGDIKAKEYNSFEEAMEDIL